MRGKVKADYQTAEKIRITPAYAGKSAGDFDESAFRGDHPRLCGEKMHFFLAGSGCIGSPPPMRGKAWHKPP